jgi:hypothetical protein
MLFQSGRREQALPYVEDAARRGDPRSEYLLGIAYFNGDLVSKDWVKAYALLTLANSAGLPQAAQALVQMDASVPLPQRQQAAGLAEQMRAQATAARGRELAAAELATGPGAAVTSPAPPVASRPVPTPSSRIPQPIPQVAVSPSIAAARAAVAEATRVTGTESPAEAGADFARPNVAAAPPASPPPVTVARAEPPPPAPGPTRATPEAAPARPRTAATGPWRVQLGAFSVAGNADRLWTQLSRRPELAGKAKLTIPAGRVTKLQAGGFATQAQAEAACRALKAAGQDCLVTTR